jgi:hypothetical protein
MYSSSEAVFRDRRPVLRIRTVSGSNRFRGSGSKSGTRQAKIVPPKKEKNEENSCLKSLNVLSRGMKKNNVTVLGHKNLQLFPVILYIYFHNIYSYGSRSGMDLDSATAWIRIHFHRPTWYLSMVKCSRLL